jgi:hypothetical protein
MKLYTKDMEPLGFKGNNMFVCRWHHFYYKKVSEKRTMYVVDALAERVMHFKMTPTEWRAYNDNKLSLVPIGCCSPTPGRKKEDPDVDFEGDFKKEFKTKKKFLSYLDELCKE